MKQFHTKGRENSGNCACFPPAHEPPPLPPFGHPLPLGGGEGQGEGAVGWFKGARRAQSSGRSLLGERAGVRASLSFISQACSRPPATVRRVLAEAIVSFPRRP